MLNYVVAAEILWIKMKCFPFKMVASRSLIWRNMQECQWPPYWPPGTKGVKHKNHFVVSQDPCGGTVFPDHTFRQVSE